MTRSTSTTRTSASSSRPPRRCRRPASPSPTSPLATRSPTARSLRRSTRTATLATARADLPSSPEIARDQPRSPAGRRRLREPRRHRRPKRCRQVHLPQAPHRRDRADRGACGAARQAVWSPSARARDTSWSRPVAWRVAHPYRHAKLVVAKFTQHHIEMMDPEKSSVNHMRSLTQEGVSVEEARGAKRHQRQTHSRERETERWVNGSGSPPCDLVAVVLEGDDRRESLSAGSSIRHELIRRESISAASASPATSRSTQSSTSRAAKSRASRLPSWPGARRTSCCSTSRPTTSTLRRLR